MKGLAASLLAAGLLATPVLAEVAPATGASATATKAPASATVSPSPRVAAVKKPATHRRHKRHAAVKPKPAAAPTPAKS